MESIYCLIHGENWKDIEIFLTKDKAIEASLTHKNKRIYIFSKTSNTSGYLPTDACYIDGLHYIESIDGPFDNYFDNIN